MRQLDVRPRQKQQRQTVVNDARLNLLSCVGYTQVACTLQRIEEVILCREETNGCPEVFIVGATRRFGPQMSENADELIFEMWIDWVRMTVHEDRRFLVELEIEISS